MAEVEDKKLCFILLRKNSKEIRDKLSKGITNVKFYPEAENKANTWLFHSCNPYEKEFKYIDGNGSTDIDGKKICETEEQAHQLLLNSLEGLEGKGYYLDCEEDVDKFIEEVNKNI